MPREVASMKTSRFFLLAAGVLLFAGTPSRADDDLLNALLDSSTNGGRPHERGGRHSRSHGSSPASGLQLSSGLQPSGPLNGSGPAPVAARMSDDEWRKLFPRKEPRQ